MHVVLNSEDENSKVVSCFAADLHQNNEELNLPLAVHQQAVLYSSN